MRKRARRYGFLSGPLVAALLLGGALVPRPANAADVATVYDIDPQHSEVSFRIRHLVTKVRGRFDELSGTIHRHPDDPSQSSVVLTIASASVNTFLAERDRHLRSDEFFAAEKYPTITFESAQVTKTDEGAFDVVGRLTMRGITREITLPVTFLGEIEGPDGEMRAGFETQTVLDRKDYGIDWNVVLDRGGLVLGNEVEVSISLQAIQRAGS